MKISKLFHWLYGILMLLPCFAILVKCAYVAFNKNAYESYSGTSTQYVQKTLQTNDINSNNDLIVGNVYLLKYDLNVSNLNVDYYLCGAKSIKLLQVYPYNYSSYSSSDRLYIRTQVSQAGSVLFIQTIESYYIYGLRYLSTNTITNNEVYLPFIYMEGQLNGIGTYIFEYPQENLQYITYYEEVEVSTLDNVFYHAVDEVCNNELFAWASNSFLNAPLTYITNLFNMPTDNAVILLMSYWFNISIIWLCFDVMIYVPLLVHRWLDKGIVD